MRMVHDNKQNARGWNVGLLDTWLTTLPFHNNVHNKVPEDVKGV